jgi:hypothetical protein
MAQAQQQQPTVKDQLMMALDQALGASNYGFADGGIVAFAGGGDINPKTQEQQDREKIISALNAAGFSAQKLAAAGFDIISMPARALMGVYNSLVRGPRAFGLNLPFIGEDSPEFISSMTPAMDAVRRAEDAKKYTEYMDPNRPPTFGAPASPAPLRGAPTPPRPAPAGAGAPAALPAPPPLVRLQSLTPSASGAPRPSPAAGAATGLGAGAGAGADVVASPAAGQIDLSNLSAAQKALAELVGQRGAVSPEVAAARAEYDRMSRTALDPAEQQLRELEAQQRRGVFSDPEALMEMLAGMGETPMTFGQALAGAGRGAAKTRAGREARIRDARSKLNQLRSDLALTQARERMARAEGDDRAVRDYKIKEAEIKAQIQATSVDLQFKQEDLEVRRRQVGAQEMAARNRPTTEDRGRLTENQRALLRERAIDNVAKDTNTVALIARARAQAARDKVPFNESAFREQLIQRQYESLVAAAEDRTIAPTPGSTPGATLSAEDRALIEKYK